MVHVLTIILTLIINYCCYTKVLLLVIANRNVFKKSKTGPDKIRPHSIANTVSDFFLNLTEHPYKENSETYYWTYWLQEKFYKYNKIWDLLTKNS